MMISLLQRENSTEQILDNSACNSNSNNNMMMKTSSSSSSLQNYFIGFQSLSSDEFLILQNDHHDNSNNNNNNNISRNNNNSSRSLLLSPTAGHDSFSASALAAAAAAADGTTSMDRIRNRHGSFSLLNCRRGRRRSSSSFKSLVELEAAAAAAGDESCSSNSNIVANDNNKKNKTQEQTGEVNHGPQQRRRRVSFNRNVYVRKVLHMNNYTDEEYDATWYNSDEMACIRKEVRKIIKMETTSSSSSSSSSSSILRGLECRTPSGLKISAEHRLTARNAILNEQCRQWNANIQDPGFLSLMCFSHSRKMLREAHERGLKDELEAVKIYKQDRKQKDERRTRRKNKN